MHHTVLFSSIYAYLNKICIYTCIHTHIHTHTCTHTQTHTHTHARSACDFIRPLAALDPFWQVMYASIHGAEPGFYPMTGMSLHAAPQLVNVPLPRDCDADECADTRTRAPIMGPAIHRGTLLVAGTCAPSTPTSHLLFARLLPTFSSSLGASILQSRDLLISWCPYACARLDAWALHIWLFPLFWD